MARLNTTKPRVLGSARFGTPLTKRGIGRDGDDNTSASTRNSRERGDGFTRRDTGEGRGEEEEKEDDDERNESMDRKRIMKPNAPGHEEKRPPLVQKGRLQQRTTTASGRGNNKNTKFDIFPDGDSASDDGYEKDAQEYHRTADASEDGGKTATTRKNPLKLTEVNSLLLHPVSRSRQARHRRTTKDDFDKENDPLEDAMDDYATHRATGDTSDVSPRRSPTRRNVGQTPGPGQDRNPRQLFWGHRRPETSDDEDERGEEGDECSHDNSFDSLDGFIVSDNEEISYYDTSDAETDNEKEIQETMTPSSPPPPPPSPPQPKTTRRRLIRGRRPTAREEPREESPFRQAPLHLEPSTNLLSLTSESNTRELFHDDFDISERVKHLNLNDDNDPSSSQLKRDMYNTVAGFYLPAEKSKPRRDILETPPSSPSKSRLRSPTKEKYRIQIPPTPYRESADAFWNQEITNDWIDQHSPQKNKSPLRAIEELLCDFSEPEEEQENDNDDNEDDGSDESDSTMTVDKRRKQRKPLSKTAQKKAEAEQRRASRARKKSFDSKKVAIAEEFFKVLDDAVSGGKVQQLAATTGGVRIVWLATLKSTAGRARWSRSLPASPGDPPGHNAVIELAEHVIDDEDRLINTLTHEYCHLANYMISGNTHERAHGRGFKKWGHDCVEALRDHPVYGGRINNVTTKHSYKINYKYVWCCVDCGHLYQRHSRSINPATVACGKCRGLLQQIKPKPRKRAAAQSPMKGQQQEQAECVVACERETVDVVVRVFEGVSLC